MPYFFNLKAMDKNNLISLSPKVIEDFIWMSYRYCIGRHTGAAIHHANTIKQVIRDSINTFSDESIQRMVADIRREINMVLSTPMNVVIDSYSELDLFSLLFLCIEENEDTTKFVYNIHERTGEILKERRLDKPIQRWESFECLYLDLIEWVKLANYLDVNSHYKVTVEYNGKQEEHICYAYPVQIGNSYTKVFSSVLEKGNSYISPEYIITVEPYESK